jgi:hypothetical protein
MINIVTSKTSLAFDEHWKCLKPMLEKRIKNMTFSIEQCERVIKCRPDEMLPLFMEWQQQGIIEIKPERKGGKVVNEQYIEQKKVCSIFNYSEFTKKENEKKGKYGAYQLAENLDIRVCPYCNRMFTTTVKLQKNEFITRPTFDHFFSQSAYPLFALSFYNLIPSCTICNETIKGAKELSLDRYIHPYVDNEMNNFDFDYEPKGINGVAKIFINVDEESKIANTLDFFQIRSIYNCHKDICEDMVQLRDIFSPAYLDSLINTFQLDVTKEELYPLIFGTCLNERDFHKYPFAKLKKDIAKRLRFL